MDTTLPIRKFPSNLRKALKVRAAQLGISLQQLVVDLLTAAMGDIHV